MVNLASNHLTQNTCSNIIAAMSIWRYIKLWLTGSHKKRKYFNVLGDSLQLRLIHPPAQEKRKRKKRPSDPKEDMRLESWNSLSRREKDVTALTCLGYTNPQIAARLNLSVETVRNYLEFAVGKLSLRKKADLRVFFANWDFSAWERRKDPYR